MKLNLMALSVAAFAIFLATDVSAQSSQQCAGRDLVIDRLAQKYGESRQSIGVAANNAVVEVYANDGTGSWTIIVTLPSGQTCMVASGTSFETLAEAQIIPGNDA